MTDAKPRADDVCRGCGRSLDHILGHDDGCPTLRDIGPVPPLPDLGDFDPDQDPWKP